MAAQPVGILFPGEMGVSIAASAQRSGHQVYWTSQGRSPATRARAEKAGLLDAGSLENLCAQCAVMLSVCPPHIAEEVASQVAGAHFHGLYLDANAIAPQRVQRMQAALSPAGIDLVDGGIIGGPAWEQDRTVLYLSGKRANEMAAVFSQGLLKVQVLGEEIGSASSLKMCFSAYSKGSTALLGAILATAERLGVYEALTERWDQGEAGFAETAARRVRGSTRKAWRFEGEMEEIAATFQEAGLPGGFHLAAAEIYRRLAGFKDAPELPALKGVLDALTST